jgi:hypothetical protein
MNYRNFEKNIKDKLYNTEADLDINQFILELNKKKQKTSKTPFLSLILLATLCLATAFFLLGKYSNQLVANNDSHNSNLGKSINSNQTSFDKNTHQNQTFAKLEQEASHTQSQQSLNPSDQTITTTKAINPTHTNININASNADHQKLSVIKENNPTQNRNSSAQGLEYNKESILNPKDINTNINQEAISIESDKLAIENNVANALESNNSTREISLKNILTDLPLRNQKLIYNSLVNIALAYTKDVQCPSFAKKSNIQFSFIPEVGYFRPLKSLANNAGENPVVYELRNKNEKTLEGLQAALYLQVQKKSSPIYFRAGINYAQMTEKMSLQYIYTVRDTSIGVISITVSQTGDTITTIYGEIITETQKKGTKIGHHKFELWDIPVSIGYEKRLVGFNLGAEIGASFNVSMSASGKLLENSIGFKDLAIDSPYKSKLGVNYFGSLFISKEILENQSVYAALRGRFIPGYFTNTGAPITEKYSMVGLHIGYKINF